MKKWLSLFFLIVLILFNLGNKYYYKYMQKVIVENSSFSETLPEKYTVVLEIDLDKLVDEGKINSYNNLKILFCSSGEFLEVPVLIYSDKTKDEKIWFRLNKTISEGCSDDNYYLVYSTQTYSSDESIEIEASSDNEKWIFEKDFSLWKQFRTTGEVDLEWGTEEDILYVFDPIDGNSAVGRKGFKFMSSLKIKSISFEGLQFFETDYEILKLTSGWGKLWQTEDINNGETASISINNLNNDLLAKDLTFVQAVVVPFDNYLLNYFKINRVEVGFADPPKVYTLGEEQIGGVEAFKYYRKLSLENTSPEYKIPAGYYIMLEMNTKDLAADDKVQEDCNDLRVFYYDSENLIWHQLERLVINPNHERTRIWFRTFNQVNPSETDEYVLYYKSKTQIENVSTLNLPFSDESDNSVLLFNDDFSDFEEIISKPGWILGNDSNLLINTEINTPVSGFAGFRYQNNLEIYDLIISGKTNNPNGDLLIEITDLNNEVIFEFDPVTQYFTDLIIPVNCDEKRVVKFKVRSVVPGTVFNKTRGLYLSKVKFDIVYPLVVTLDINEYTNEDYSPGEEEKDVEYENKFSVINNLLIGEEKKIIINISHDREESVKIDLYDISGKKVAAIFNERIAPGIKTITWDCNMLNSGTYYIVCETGSRVYKRTIMKIR
ncbi:T9SS type A sorting domain-containing protein [Candidatus Dependentiae bacterium]|nr:T9SS type A sorting domain-containing protein [Candidatus Dependentiae bacterium]